jgi:heme/copper-type cytochrome/quinol oxidase subunit 2
MIATDELNQGELRLMEVDNKIVLPIATNVRIIVSSGDVIHC